MEEKSAGYTGSKTGDEVKACLQEESQRHGLERQSAGGGMGFCVPELVLRFGAPSDIAVLNQLSSSRSLVDCRHFMQLCECDCINDQNEESSGSKDDAVDSDAGLARASDTARPANNNPEVNSKQLQMQQDVQLFGSGELGK